MDFGNIINSFLKKESIQEQSIDEKVLALRSETIKKVDCAITVKNTVEPLIKVIRLNVFVYITIMLAFVLLGTVGLFLCFLGLAFNLYYSKKQSDLIFEVQEKYKIR